jgi:hypothetical protein
MAVLRFIVVALALAVASTTAVAQEGQEGSILDQLPVGGASATSGAETEEDVRPDGAPEILFPDLPQNFEPNEETLAALQEAVQGYYEYRSNGYMHRQRVFEWQLVSSSVIFAMVVLIVLVGLYFSWLQFRLAMKTGKSETTTLEASQTGFKVSSPVLGVIILTLSLAFFYLYLIYVYPIVDTF